MPGGGVCCVSLLVLLCCVCDLASVVGSAVPSDSNADNVIESCAAVRPIFESKNISADIPEEPVNGRDLAVCVSAWSCCSRQMEAGLQRQVRSDFQALLRHNSRSLQGLLVSAANSIREHVLELLRQSENKTASLFEQQYRRISAQARGPVTALYSALAGHVDVPLQQSPDVDLEEAVAGVFAGLFPLVYRHAVSPRARDFAADYQACLREVAPELQPFGDAPRQLARSVQRALEAARVLRQALLLGADVLNATDSLLTGEDGPPGGAPAQAQCHTALLRMSYCSRCHGLHRDVRPCAGLCLNVLRGCLTSHATELDLPWNGYVEAAERLVVAVQGHGAVDDVLRSLDGRIADAVMAAVEQSTSFQQQVKRVCGPHMWDYGVADEDAVTEDGGWSHGSASQDSLTGADGEQLSSKLQPFLASLKKSRGFYANLAESLCSDESFAETRDTADCWNGQRVGEYTKTVVASSPVAQKYNPELRWVPVAPDARIAELSDQLRHLKQVLASQVAEAPTALSLVRYDEGEGEGSGGGAEAPGDWDAEPEAAWREGSGSGDRPVVVGGDTLSTDNTIYPSSEEDGDKHGIGASSKRRPGNMLLVVCSVFLTSHILYVANM